MSYDADTRWNLNVNMLQVSKRHFALSNSAAARWGPDPTISDNEKQMTPQGATYCKYNYHHRRRHRHFLYANQYFPEWNVFNQVCEVLRQSLLGVWMIHVFSIQQYYTVLRSIQLYSVLHIFGPLPAAAGPLARTKEWRCRRLHSHTKRLPKCHGHYSAYILCLFDICNTDRVFDSPQWMG